MDSTLRNDIKKLESKIKAVIARLLQLPVRSISIKKSFVDLGINSVLAVELIEALNEELGLELGVEVVFDYTDLKSLAAYVAEQAGTEDAEEEQKPAGMADRLIAVLAELLETSPEELDAEKSFVELGVSSVLAVEFIEALNRELDLELGVEVIFDYAGIRELAAHISAEYGMATEQSVAAAVEVPMEVQVEIRSSDIAIIGISGKFAGSDSLEEFWSHLAAGDRCIEEIKREGWEQSRYYHPDPSRKNRSVSKWGGLLNNIDRFDAAFFSITPQEAENMDPQQRLFLEEAFKAFEDGGYSSEQLSGRKVGVYVGGRASNYKEKTQDDLSSQNFLGNEMSILAARLSYFLNLKGPSLAVDTACSSSLVAIHLASESIRRGEAEMALAGGVFVLSSPEFFVMSSKMGMLSPDGECRTFDNEANGMVLGEGVGAVVLKRLEDAIADGDHIYGVIKGSAMNQTGRANGMTAPSMSSQKELILDAYRHAAIDPQTVSYIEAHGTGTQLGDPIEVKALAEAFRTFTDEKQFCALGSHKPNFGHATMASGIASLFKVLLAMKHRQLPPTIGIKQANRHIDFANSPFYLNTQLREWTSASHAPLRAGVSSFGSNGTNCHLVVEAPPAVLTRSGAGKKPYYLFPLSAMTSQALRQKAADLARWLEAEAELHELADISYTLCAGRNHYSHRCVFIARDLHELKQALQGSWTEEKASGKADAKAKKLGERLIGELRDANLSDEEYREQLLALAELYLKQVKLNWGELFAAGEHRRVPLPAYPFGGERYWMSGSLQTVTDQVMEGTLARLLWTQLQSLGWFVEKGPVRLEAKAGTGLRDRYDRWLEESMRLLARQGYLREDGLNSYSVIDPSCIDSDAVWQEWEREKVAWEQHPALKSHVRLVEATLRALPEILTGKRLATDIMFPNSSMELVRGIYASNPVADSYNETLAATAAALVEQRIRENPAANIRILEIGAGTGGTSAFVFHALEPYRDRIAEYCYTDLSKAFLLHAQQQYGPAYPYLTYRIFNAEAPAAKQGIEVGAYDVVIAANVIHATKDVRKTLRNSKALLRENGVVLLNEISRNSAFLHLTFGLLEGWWLYEDTDLRIPGCPALSAQSWQRALEAEGFRSVMFPNASAHEMGQQIVQAESDGVVLGAAEVIAQPEKPRAVERAPLRVQRLGADHVKDTMIDKLAAALQVEPDSIDSDEAFRDYGVDSILGVNLIQEINQALGIDLETTILFDYSSVNQLGDYIATRYKDQLEALPQQEQDQYEPLAAQGTAEGKAAMPDGLPLSHASVPVGQPLSKEPIAIIGMSGRFAKSRNVHQLWEHLANGTDLVEEVTRWELPERKYGALLEEIDLFDPLFFNISGLEATYMDPQQRLFLEESWKALEDAGYAGDSVRGRQCGVYVGCTKGDYQSLIGEQAPAQAFWGNMESIVPARISYYLDLQGPAVTVDTACSSSLTSIHLACQSLWAGEIEMALAGGVFVQTTPAFYLSTEKAGMLSPTGRCHTFDDRADGFVPGEGVGVLVLKRLQDALNDGDHVYGVIRGSGINQDGTTNGITAPSANSQERLERSVYDAFGIRPEQIQMVEAHGTGTKLGDPIEYQALTRAFRHYTDQKEYCAIGSIKTNLGHTQIAAGVTGAIKILLSLQHKQIPPTLHFDKGNANIQFDGSPFYVNTQLRDWTVETGAERCAVVSSFGASGTNAHMVIGEAPQTGARRHREQPGYLVVLSARTSDQLREQAEQLAAYCERELQADCGNISYTLLMGRKHLSHRLACIVRDREELASKLRKWLERGKASQVHVSELNDKGHREQASLKRYGNQSIQNLREAASAADYLEQLSAVAELYVQGYSLDYGLLFAGDGYSRVPLPTYPFARERYWVQAEARSEKVVVQADVLHPLLQRNTSDLSEQRFSSVFSGREFFLSDHVVKGQRVLPGVAYLEMARAAFERAAGQTGVRLTDVVWARPIVVGEEPVEVHIALYPEQDGVAYEIYSGTDVVHSQGVAVLQESAAAPVLDLAALRAQCRQGTVTFAECYDAFRAIGIDYGPAHKGVQEIHAGAGQVLAKLSLPASVADAQEAFVLHPSLMDSALQASVALSMSFGGTDLRARGTALKPTMPFALEELEVLGGCTQEMWAWVRYSDGSAAGDKVEKFDIDLCDAAGVVRIRLKRFTARVLEGEIAAGEQGVGEMMLAPVWDAVPVVLGAAVPSAADKVVVAGETHAYRAALLQQYPHAILLDLAQGDDIVGKLQEIGPFDHLVWVAPLSNRPAAFLGDESLVHAQRQGVLQVFQLVKALLQLGYDAREFGWTLLTTQTQRVLEQEAANPAHASLYGLAGAMAKEYPNWSVRVVDLEAGSQLPFSELFALPSDPQGNLWVHRAGEWYRQKLVPVDPSFDQGDSLYREHGVYVVIGGAGGIGEVWSEHMIRHYKAQIVWIGRRALNADIQARIDRLAAFGPAPLYLSADATDRDALQRACDEVKARFSKVDGVVHSAIVLLDKSLANMDEERFQAGLAAKVDISVRIAQVFGREPLDFALFFSSINSFTKSAGQSNYASGCTFKDAFASALSQAWPCAVKVMNWGYWGSVGIVATEAYQERLAGAGFGSIEPAESMAALQQLLDGPFDQLVFMKTTKPQPIESMATDEEIEVLADSLDAHVRNISSYTALPGPVIQQALHERDRNTREMDELLVQLLRGHLQAVGNGLHAMYGRWMEESQRVLDAFPAAPVDLDAVWQEWDRRKAFWLQDANFAAQAALVEATMRVLPEILTGKTPATDILFPGASMAMVEGIYKNNAISDYLNEVLADTLIAYLEERLRHDPNARIRILEIGAGTGGTSATVFRKLQPYQQHIEAYAYTDLSKAFLLHAQREYGAIAPYLAPQIFDVEKPLEGQDMQPGSYDVAIATNVLHATRNLRQTLRHAKAALRKNGLLLVNELSGNTLFAHLTFGLLDGWWLFDDEAARITGCPLVAPQTWQRLLELEGFRSVFLPSRGCPELGQQIIAGESDGVIRQRRQARKQAAVIAVAPQPQLQLQPANPQARPTGESALRDQATAYLKQLVGDTLQIPAHKIDSFEPLEHYGIDSILVVQLTGVLRKVLDHVSSTLFFEYQTIDALVDHFLRTQKDAVAALVGFDEQQPVAWEETPAAPLTMPVQAQAPSRRKSQRFLSSAQPASVQPQPQPHAAGVQEIAIVGLAGRYPGARDVNEFWNLLKEGRSGIREIPADRWEYTAYFDKEKGKPGAMYTKWGGFIEDIDKFDPLFFHISPKEAEGMDPQERLFLETAHAAIEEAGYTPAALSERGKVGVFVGVMNGNYPTGSTYWSIANRLSYLLNFQGPSLAVDTACSSSLTAIHLALESLYSGTSDLAIAGGVNLIVDPVHYMRLSELTMLSEGDQCRSFGDGADGFVDGEGVGALLLKPLHKAEADGDHIYGVIKGSMLNAGGKTNGYTVPNPVAQGELVRAALERAGVNARAVSYLEAHGTGTALGDPIEIAGLTRAFSEHTADTQFCAIGSSKSNIGHCESAAGIAGLTKILLQMKHRQLAPTLHAKVTNPEIDFGRTPFAVQQTLADWQRPVVDGQEQPRIAGISSFGAGGANAHLVVQEYIPRTEAGPRMTISPQRPAVILLSAKNEERLTAKARQLLASIQANAFSEQDLADLAYTLQVGREAMEERLAVTVASLQELEQKLAQFADGAKVVSGLHRGQVKRSIGALSLFAADEELQEAVEKWIERGKYAKLLELWVQGLAVDWTKLYKGVRPRRLSLPTYPFARERYWLSEAGRPAVAAGGEKLHALVHRNTSTFRQQQFSSTFTGEEFFLAHHLVQGQRVLPGVAHLEMARAAIEQAAEGHAHIRLKNVGWMRPLVVSEQPVQVEIRLQPEDSGEIFFEISSETVHSQGTAVLSTASDRPVIDIAAVRAQCSGQTISAADCYEILQAMGIEYGPGQRALQAVHAGQGQLLAKLQLPTSAAGPLDAFVLHPSLLDSALQASAACMTLAEERGPVMPFALQELEVFGACTESMWAVIRHHSNQQIDIDVCDEQGNVRVRLKGISTRRVQGDGGRGTVLLHPVWKAQAAERVASRSEHLVLLCGVDCAELNGARVRVLQSAETAMAQHFETIAVQAFAEVQSVLLSKPRDRVLIQVVVPHEEEGQLLAALSGMLRTAALENPQVAWQLIEIEPGMDAQEVADMLIENRSASEGHIRCSMGQRWVAGWEESSAESSEVPWREGGVYLITGGAGGLGLIFAEEIARSVQDATIILCGRSPLSDQKQDVIQKLGARVQYRQADVTDEEAVHELLHSIRSDFGALHGIIHSAGVTRDNFIIRKTGEEWQDVLGPKVAGTVNLDLASKGLPLDFFLLFSSASSTLGNIGQADYATANAFLDAYARYRNALPASELRKGRTLSVNWPLWQDGGMQMDEQKQASLEQAVGMTALSSAAGIRALYQAIAAGHDQVMVMAGDPVRLRESLLEEQAVPASVVAVEPGLHGLHGLEEQAVGYFKKLLSSAIKLPVQRIEADAPLEKYGIDSILVMQLTQQLEKSFGSLPKTLFFEYQTIQELAEYFLESYREPLAKLLGRTEKPVAAAQQAPAIAIRPERQRFASVIPARQAKQESRDIAIIGVSGRYPKAGDLHAFWNNLRDGVDCITEIPGDRWDHSLYFDERKNQPGTTYTKWGGFLDGVDRFDPLFFNISPREAELMDPQERLFLECVYETLEDAGYTRDRIGTHAEPGIGGNVGVYVGVMYAEYPYIGVAQTLQGRPVALGGSPSSIANRVSYFCNFHGPSMALDTMCSSSLTAIHLACQSLLRGECEAAIAGGVNVSIHPNKYLMLGQGKFASSKGRCESFGEGGDGYVPGEGVGAVLLKPLAQAIADGDHIYGVIKGTSINHGGKTNGYTVPNPAAQARVIGRALKDAGVDPRAVSYLEAHGTGTSLGDPIEIAALTKAFGEHTQDRQFCSIGSAKSNIGHCESAAGIAGVTKVLLQMKHRQLVPSLHSQTLNPHIDFASTPFAVQQELAEWKRPVVDGQEQPRMAGISSFGAGGSNAHVVIQEYVAEDAVQEGQQQPAVIVLSAKDEDRLQELVQRLLGMIEERSYADRDLADIAYTLQVGREAMEERLAIVAGSIGELEEKLRGVAAGLEDIDCLYRGQVKRNKDLLAVFAADEDMARTLDAWVAKGKYGKLLELWVKGLTVNWEPLHRNRKPRRLPLPVYPFARERCWYGSGADAGPAMRAAQEVLHPLVHRNTSDLAEQKFTSAFTGQEFFFASHVVNGQRLLPGVAYLEMARAAFEQAAAPYKQHGEERVLLHNIVWSRPLVVADEAVSVQIGLRPTNDGEVAFEVCSGDSVVHGQGTARLTDGSPAPSLNLAQLLAECGGHTLEAEHIYEAFRSIGFEYGPAHQGLERIHVGAGQVLAELSLPAAVAGTLDDFVLHPSLLDSALQAVIGLMDGRKPALPFAVDEVEVFGACTARMWALLRIGSGQKFDLDLCDEQGTVRVRIKGLSARTPQGDSSRSQALMYHPAWQLQPAAGGASGPQFAKKVVVLCEVEGELEGAPVIALRPAASDQDVAGRFRRYASRVLAELQSLIRETSALVQVVVPAQGEGRLFSALSGMLRTAQLENPKLIGQVIEVDSASGLSAKLAVCSRRTEDRHIRYQDGERWVLGLTEADGGEVAVPWKDRGVYLITGGAGGLGLIFAQEIAQQVQDATLILTGRSPLGAEKRAQLEALNARVEYRQVDVTDEQAVANLVHSIPEQFGTLNGIIHSAGVLRDRFILNKTTDDLQQVLAPKVAGVVHLDQASRDLPLDFFILFSSGTGVLGNAGQADYAAANAFLDAYAKYRADLAASGQRHGKTLSVNWPLWREGGMSVDAETERLLMQRMGMIPMETATGIRALCQAYASGCEQVLVMEGVPGRMRESLQRFAAASRREPEPDREVQEFLVQTAARLLRVQTQDVDVHTELSEYGMDAIALSELRDAVNREYRLDLSPAALLEHSTLNGLAAHLTPFAKPAVPEQQKHEASKDIKEQAETYLAQLLSPILKLPAHRIDPEAPFEKYGIDSVMAMQLTEQLETEFGALSKTLLFEYRSIQDLAAFFLDAYRAPLQKVFAAGEEAEVVPSPAPRRQPQARFAPAKQLAKAAPKSSGDIAIIGISGRFPGAQNVQEFWQNLRAGRDCITEVPADRWDHSQYFDEDRNQSGKAYSKWGGFIEGVDLFDPLFFHISPRDAAMMDPQERLFLETVWNLLEGTGHTREGLQRRYQGSVGVYVGAMYQPYHAFDAPMEQHAVLSLSSYSSIANRASYYFNLQGPSIAIDTACSSSTIAVHMACESLQKGDCKLAIAGGVNLSIHPKKFVGLSQVGMLGSHPDSRSFGDGDGYLPAETVGAVLLKPLEAAERDGDTILAVIKSSAINHGGQSNGFSVPNPQGQAQLIAGNFAKSGIDPRTISYVESAVNGSALGDPIELNALTRAFRQFTDESQFCAIGSVKSNIGHAEAASGISQLTKVILQLQHQELVPPLLTGPLNPNLELEGTPFYLQRERTRWERPFLEIDGQKVEVPRRATVSSFGAGGSNAHLIIEEYIPQPQEAAADDTPQLIVFSAKNQDRLRAVVEQMLAHLQEREVSLRDLAYTLQAGREAMESRLALVAESRDELIRALHDYLTGAPASVPLFIGDLEDEVPVARHELAGERDLEKIALHWCRGGRVAWESLHERARIVSLPTYPFAKKRYWIEDAKSTADDAVKGSVQDEILRFLSQELELPAEQIKVTKNLLEYGVNSILVMKLMRHLEKGLGVKVKGRDVLEHPTVAALSAYIASRSEGEQARGMVEMAASAEAAPDALEKFKQGTLSLDELETLLDEGGII